MQNLLEDLKELLQQDERLVVDGKTTSVGRKEKEYKLSDFGEHIVRKAINKLEFYKFSNLKRLFPNLNSISEFIRSESYLGNIKLDVSGLSEQISNLSPREKLEASLKVLEDISATLVTPTQSRSHMF